MPVLSNAKHELFAQGLAQGKSASEAYEAAGYKANRHNAARLNTNEHVRRRVEELITAAAEKAEVSVARVLEELAKIGFSNMLDYMKPSADGTAALDLSRLTRDQAAAIGEMTFDYDDQVVVKEGEEPATERVLKRIKFKLSDKRAALVDLGRHLGMFKDRIEHSGPSGTNIRIDIDVDDD